MNITMIHTVDQQTLNGLMGVGVILLAFRFLSEVAFESFYRFCDARGLGEKPGGGG